MLRLERRMLTSSSVALEAPIVTSREARRLSSKDIVSASAGIATFEVFSLLSVALNLLGIEPFAAGFSGASVEVAALDRSFWLVRDKAGDEPIVPRRSRISVMLRSNAAASSEVEASPFSAARSFSSSSSSARSRCSRAWGFSFRSDPRPGDGDRDALPSDGGYE